MMSVVMTTSTNIYQHAGQTLRHGQEIQALIDHTASQGGGQVVIPPGVYLLHDAIHLRDNIHLDGQGKVTLLKAPSVASPLKRTIGYGHFAFCPVHPEKFHVGMGIAIHDKNSGGFYDTAATITAQDGDWFFIDRMANHDYIHTHDAMVRSLFPMIQAQGVRNASARNITLDGQADQSEKLNGCRGGAVFLIQSHDITLQNLTITNYNGEGISFQQCTDLAITHCDISSVTGNGIHPGSGSVRYVITHNHCHHNDEHGIFYCLRTTHSHCAHNHIQRNGQSGICIGQYDTHHLFEHNTIEHNAGPAILFRKTFDTGGHQTLFEHNTFHANAAKPLPHQAEVVMEEPLEDVHFIQNTFKPRPGVNCLWPEKPVGRNIRFEQNSTPEQATPLPTLPASDDDMSTAALKKHIHPASLALDGARHLNIATLPAWEDRQ